MQLTDLPEEVLIIIIRKLDLKSAINLYYTCRRTKNIVCGVLKQCCMSRNILATVNTLKLDFFKDISYSLQELNMCGVHDLSKTMVLAAMKKLQHLKVLDISYTNLDILDLLEIHKVCPTLKDITVNLQCGKYGNVPKDISLQCQSVFEHFINVHFVGTFINFLFSKFVLFILAKSQLHHLKYTRVESSSAFVINDSLIFEDDEDIILPDFDQFTAYIIDWKNRNTTNSLGMTLSDFPVLSFFTLEKYEYVLITIEDFDPEVYASPIFVEFFKEKFSLSVKSSDAELKLSPNMAVMIWNKAAINFNDIFFNRLSKVLKHYLPCYFQLNEMNKLPIFEYDWFYTTPREPDDQNSYTVKRIGNKRVAAPKFLLNYDDMFAGKENLELTIIFKSPINCAISLTTDCEYLRKLTYLSFINFGRYSSDFFSILFRCCVNLKTLNVEGLALPPCASTIACNLPLSQSLKNLRLVDRSINFTSLFRSFTQCPTLENIYVVDESVLRNDLADPALVVEQCKQLYSVYLETEMSNATRSRILQLFNKAKKLYDKSYLRVVIKPTTKATRAQETYDAFIDVFRLNPIRPL